MELRDYLRGLRRHWLAIVVMTLVGLSVGGVWSIMQTRVYEATASGFVRSQASTQTLNNYGSDSLAMSKVPSYLQIATWRTVAQHAIEDLHLNTTPEALVNRITVTNPNGTTVLNIQAQGPTPLAARDLAEAWVKGLVATIDQVEGNGKPGSAPVTVILGESAALPTTPIFPDWKSALAVGGVVGFGFGLAFALMRTASDRRIRSAADIESRIKVPVVGTIPLAAGLDGDHRLVIQGPGASKNSFAAREALRTLRTNLQFMDVDHPPRVIVVTSPLPGDGKSTVASNLAFTLAVSGRPVILIDGDLRRSSIAKTMGLPGGAGLSDVLAGRATIEEVVQQVPHSENLAVLTAGTVPPNPSEVLGSERMRTLVRDLSEHATVIVDAPPLLPVTDGAVLAHQADGALVVVTTGKTTYELTQKALNTLEKVHGRVLGIVLNRVPTRGADATAYYAYGYSTSSPAPAAAPSTAFGPGRKKAARAGEPAGSGEGTPAGPERAVKGKPAKASAADAVEEVPEEAVSFDDLLRHSDADASTADDRRARRS